MEHIIVSQQLLGDGLMATPAIEAYYKALPKGDTLRLILEPGSASLLYRTFPFADVVETRVGIDDLVATPDRPLFVLDTPLAFDLCVNGGYRQAAPPGSQPHMSYGYAAQVGVEIASTHYTLHLTGDDEIEAERHLARLRRHPLLPLIVLAPMSRTNRQGCEAIWPVWHKTLAQLSETAEIFINPVGLDRWPGSRSAHVVEDYDLRHWAIWCRRAAAVIAVDTGLGHVAQAMDANIVSIANGMAHWMTSVAATRGRYALIEAYGPHYKIAPEQILQAVRDMIPEGHL